MAHRHFFKALRTGPRQHRQVRSLGVVTGTVMSEVAMDRQGDERTVHRASRLISRRRLVVSDRSRVSSRCATPVHGTHRAVE